MCCQIAKDIRKVIKYVVWYGMNHREFINEETARRFIKSNNWTLADYILEKEETILTRIEG